MSDRNSWLSALLLPLAILLLVPGQHAGKVALVALVLTIILYFLMVNTRALNIQNGSRPAKIIAVGTLSMFLLSSGGCLRHVFMNPNEKHDFVLFNGSNKTISVALGDKGVRLEPRQILEETVRLDKGTMRITDPANMKESVPSFNKGVTFLAYGSEHVLLVEEVDYRRVTLFNPNPKGSGMSNSWEVKNEILNMPGEFVLYTPGEKIPTTVSQSQHSNWCYLSLSVKNDRFFQYDVPARTEDEIMKEAVRRAIQKTIEQQ